MNPFRQDTRPVPPHSADPRQRDALELPRSMDRIAVCEPRLALSASAAADVLLEAFAADPFGLGTHSGSTLTPTAMPLREPSPFDGSGQTVAVIDTGIAWDHEVFARPTQGASGSGAGSGPGDNIFAGMGSGHRVVAGWDFAEGDANPYDDGPAGFHGTHVAGTLAGHADGFSGIAAGADLVALRVFDDIGRSRLDWIESALRWVIDHRTSLDHPITTVNLSLGAFVADEGQPLTQLDDELQQLRNDGVLVVAAAGNSYQSSQPSALAYPASHPLVAAVTSVDGDGNLQDFAQRASGIFAMPGAAVRSSVPDHVLGVDGQIDDFAEIGGTSMAAPQFAGATMLVRQAMQSIGQIPTIDDILSQLRGSALERMDAISGATVYEVDVDAAISDLLAEHTNAPIPAQPQSSPLHWTDPSSLVVRATSGSDEIVLDLSGPNTITVNSVVFPVQRPFESLLIEGDLGNDTLRIIGGAGDERVIARAALPGLADAAANLQRLGLAADFRGFENVMLQGGGGNDRVTFFDSAQDDSLEATASGATLRGVGFTFVAVDVKNVYAHAVNGGSDTAYLYDTVDDDRLAIRHQFTSLRSDSQFRLAYGFEKVQAFGGSGGQDHADLYDSPGDDRLAASASFASISSRDYYAGARGFATVRAEASSGGDDYATLYAVDTNSLWTRSVGLLQCTLPSGDTRTALGFEVAEAYVGGDKVEISPQSLTPGTYEQERRALRDLFARLGDGESHDPAELL